MSDHVLVIADSQQDDILACSDLLGTTVELCLNGPSDFSW